MTTEKTAILVIVDDECAYHLLFGDKVPVINQDGFQLFWNSNFNLDFIQETFLLKGKSYCKVSF